ncbi:MAG TPA: cupin domain-containing protein [Blastocatellia bacterium]|nr:cupin domain-containing protein [Blastocatellia bacterium]
MITRRDLMVALFSVTATVTVVAFARSENSVMTSMVWDWNKIPATPTKVGAVRKFFQAPTPTLKDLECHVTTLNPGETPHAPHKHPAEEVLIIREGTVEVLNNGEYKRVGPGSVIFQASNQMHTIKNVGTTPATYHVFQWVSEKTPAK